MDDVETDDAEIVMIPMYHPCFTGDTIAWKGICFLFSNLKRPTLTNTHYKPEIFKPKTWVPSMEARPRNIIRLNITTHKKTSTGTYTQREDISTDTDNQLPKWTALTTTQLLKLYPSCSNELLAELDISPSSSTSTICLDEETDTDREVAIHSVFKCI